MFVASSDLSHFYPYRIARKLDAELLHRLEAFDPLGVIQAETEGAGFACGCGAIAPGIGLAEVEPTVKGVIEQELATIDDFTARLARGELPVW